MVFFCFLLFTIQLPAQTHQDSLDCLKKRKWVTFGGSALYGSAITGLSFLWYKDNFGGGFRFFNDGDEWRGMDKIGHFYAAYYQSYYVSQLLKAACFNEIQQFWIGGLSGFFMQLPIEILDGFSADYGASMYDVAANGMGSALYMAQEYYWHEQKILPKFSFFPTQYAQYNPSLLGSNLVEQLIKDYNGQTYWLSYSMHNVLFLNSFPPWLCFSVGYSIDGVLRGTATDQINDHRFTPMQRNPDYRQSQFVLSLDIDMRKIPVKKTWQKTLLHSINFLKIPFPAVVYSTNGSFRVSGLYY